VHKVGRFKIYSILLLALLINLTVLNRLSIFGARPDLLVICVTFFGLFIGRSAGLESGLVAGALTDVFSLDYFGINTSVYGATGFLAGVMKTNFSRESRRTQALIVFFCTAFSMCLHFSLASTLSRSISLELPEYFKTCVIPEGLYTAIISVPIFKKIMDFCDLREQDDLL
jgi:rod shape-determining protein MreD